MAAADSIEHEILPRQAVPTAVAGATGFIGRALCEALTQRGHPVIALSRQRNCAAGSAGILWRKANLFQLREVEGALAGAKQAVYLVHSMLPSARLSQGSFADLDLICADNFARAARAAGVERILYVGGLMPPKGPISAHLKSRQEVERALASHGVPLIALRAGIVFGPGGSSSDMLINLVERLPVLVLPKWCQSRCQPTSLKDIVRTLCQAIEFTGDLGALAAAEPLAAPGSATFDVGNEDILSYSDMLRRTAKALGRRRLFIPVPAFTPSLSLWWVSWVTSTSMALAAPLVGSLLHDLLVRQAHDAKQSFAGPWQTFAQSLACALETHKASRRRGRAQLRRTPAAERARGVVSVQRLQLPAGKDAAWVARHYIHWLTHSALWLRPWVRIEQQEAAAPAAPAAAPAAMPAAVAPARSVRFISRLGNILLLELHFAPTRSNPQRQLFYIAGGLLTRPTDAAAPGRFEFREVLHGRFVLAAIYDFVPRLPWLLYKFTQAIVHALVMAGFRRHLAHVTAANPGPFDSGH